MKQDVSQMTEEEALAMSRRYGHRQWMVQQLPGDDRWALFNDKRELIAVGPWGSLAELYAPIKRQQPSTKADINLKDLGL